MAREARSKLRKSTYCLQLVLPELLLLRLVEKGKFADMVHKDVSKDWKLRIKRRHLAKVRLEGRAESAKGSRRVELRNFPPHLLRDELALEVWSPSI